MLITSKKLQATTHVTDQPRKASRPATEGSRISVPKNFMRSSFSWKRRQRRSQRTGASNHAPSRAPVVGLVSRGKETPWVPAPGKSHRAQLRERVSFPLCLVCDRLRYPEKRDGGRLPGHRGHVDLDLEEAEVLKRLNADAETMAELEEAAHRQSMKQRRKVLMDLWNMDGGTSEQRLRKWCEVLQHDFGASRPRRGLTNPDPQHSFKPIKPEKTTVVVHKEPDLKEKMSDDKVREAKKASKDAPDRNLASSVAEKNVLKSPILRTKKRELDATRGSTDDFINVKDRTGKGAHPRKDSEGDSTTVSVTFSSSKLKHSPKKEKKRRRKKHAKSDRSDQLAVQKNPDEKWQKDYFVEVILDDMKRENTELRQSLRARDEQLNTAADKIKEMVEENARLAKQLEKTLSRVEEHAHNFEHEMESRDAVHRVRIEQLQTRLDDANNLMATAAAAKEEDSQQTVELLKRQLNISLKRNAEMQEYIDKLKETYFATFDDKGKDSGDKTSSTLSAQECTSK